MTNRIASLWLIPVLAFVTFLAGCGGGADSAGDGADSASRPVVIGLAAPFTGRSAAQGKQMEYGVKAAIAEINENGGLGGQPVELLSQDDESRPDTAAQVAQRFVNNPDVAVVIGHFNSSCSIAGSEIYNAAEMLQITPASTNPDVTIGKPWTYRNIFNDIFQGQTLADYASKRLGHTKAAVLYENDSYGKGLYDYFKARAAENGLELTSEMSYETETTDFRPLLTQVKDGDPEILVVCGLYRAGGQIAAQAAELGIKLPIIGGDGLLSDDLISIGGEPTEGLYVTAPFLFELAGDRGEAFAARVRKQSGVEPDAWAALAYDAMMLVNDAVENHGVAVDSKAIRDHLKTIDSEEVAFDGLTGLTYFDENGDCLKPVQIAQVRDGKFQAAPIQMTDELTEALKSDSEGAAE
ncbi:MAG: ABC transporter substrate-binding protein [Sumerlaeia bacterium]